MPYYVPAPEDMFQGFNGGGEPMPPGASRGKLEPGVNRVKELKHILRPYLVSAKLEYFPLL